MTMAMEVKAGPESAAQRERSGAPPLGGEGAPRTILGSGAEPFREVFGAALGRSGPPTAEVPGGPETEPRAREGRGRALDGPAGARGSSAPADRSRRVPRGARAAPGAPARRAALSPSGGRPSLPRGAGRAAKGPSQLSGPGPRPEPAPEAGIGREPITFPPAPPEGEAGPASGLSAAVQGPPLHPPLFPLDGLDGLLPDVESGDGGAAAWIPLDLESTEGPPEPAEEFTFSTLDAGAAGEESPAAEAAGGAAGGPEGWDLASRELPEPLAEGEAAPPPTAVAPAEAEGGPPAAAPEAGAGVSEPKPNPQLSPLEVPVAPAALERARAAEGGRPGQPAAGDGAAPADSAVPAGAAASRGRDAPSGGPVPLDFGPLDFGEGRDRWAERVSAALRRQIQLGSTRLRLQIHPPRLGQLELRMSMRGSALRLSIDVESNAVRHLLGAGVADLRESLREAGLEVERLRIAVREPEESAERGTHPDSGGKGGGGGRGEDAPGDEREAPAAGGDRGEPARAAASGEVDVEA